MPEENKTKSTVPRMPTACVRLTKEEWVRLKEDSKISGKSIPKLLKDRYFSRVPLRPLLHAGDQKILMTALARIGNNLNQIAKKLNYGIAEGVNDDLIEIRSSFSQLVNFTSGIQQSSKKK